MSKPPAATVPATGSRILPTSISQVGTITKYELVNTYARQQARFTKQSIIRCAFEFQQVVQIRVVGSQPGKDAFAFAAALGWDKTMCMVLS